MQKLSVIALLFVFLLSQYGRNLAYLECQLYNLVQSGAGIRCDCERMAPRTDPAGKPDLPPLQKVSGVHLDEHFIQAGLVWPVNHTAVVHKNKWPFLYQAACPGFREKILRPPQAIA